MVLKRVIVRSLLCLATLTIGLTDTAPQAVAPAHDQVARLQTVKLRKLHLVRPDLIPYPIAYEVVC